MTQIRDWPWRYRVLYRQARHQVILSQMKPVLSFDAENNWQGEVRPNDIKAYWAGLTETERAFEILEQTEAAVFMAFHDRIMNSIPKLPIQP